MDEQEEIEQYSINRLRSLEIKNEKLPDELPLIVFHFFFMNENMIFPPNVEERINGIDFLCN